MDNIMIDPSLLLWSLDFYPPVKEKRLLSTDQQAAWINFYDEMFENLPEYGYEITVGKLHMLEDFFTSTTAHSKNWW